LVVAVDHIDFVDYFRFGDNLILEGSVHIDFVGYFHNNLDLDLHLVQR
jgi:hypothetical protein